MRPRRTPHSTHCLDLEGGTEDNALWVEITTAGDHTLAEDDPAREAPVFASVWELDDDDRRAIAAGANIALCVYGFGHPPVRLGTTTVDLGKGPSE